MNDHTRLVWLSDGIPFQELMSVYEGYQVREIPFSQLAQLTLDPDEIVLLYEEQIVRGPELVLHIKQKNIKQPIIFLTQTMDGILVRSVLEASPDEFLFVPDEFHLLEDRIHQLKKSTTSPEVVEESCKVICFYSPKGGVGSSLLTATFGQSICLDSHKKVLVMDVNFQHGGLDDYLQIRSGKGLHLLTPVLEEITPDQIRHLVVTDVNSPLDAMVGAVPIDQLPLMTPKHIQATIEVARQMYDWILIDLPTQFTPLSWKAIEIADHIIYLLEPSAQCFHLAQKSFAYLNQSGLSIQNKIEIVLNKYSVEREIGSEQIAQCFPYPILGVIAEDRKKLPYYLNRGIPIRTQNKQKSLIPFAKNVQKVVKQLIQP